MRFFFYWPCIKLVYLILAHGQESGSVLVTGKKGQLTVKDKATRAVLTEKIQVKRYKLAVILAALMVP